MSGVVVGLGLASSATADEVGPLVDAVLAAAGRTRADILTLATIDTRADHPAVTALTAEALPLATFPASALAEVAVPHPSDAVEASTGTPSVAEAAALLAAAAHVECPTLLVTKTASAHATAAVAAEKGFLGATLPS